MNLVTLSLLSAIGGLLLCAAAAMLGYRFGRSAEEREWVTGRRRVELTPRGYVEYRKR